MHAKKKCIKSIYEFQHGKINQKFATPGESGDKKYDNIEIEKFTMSLLIAGRNLLAFKKIFVKAPLDLDA